MTTKKLLITGASGNVGYEIIRGLFEIKSPHLVIAAAHNLERAREVLSEFEGLEFRKLDFTRTDSFPGVLKDVDTVFLLRPPQLADVSSFFEPFLEAMLDQEIRQIVFLSVQGVENQKSIPHHKMEKLILQKGLDYVFLRPSYFMQNLVSTLAYEIRTRDVIFVPSGKLKFTWVDVRDIGLVGGHILNDFERFRNKPYVITGSEQKDFKEVAALLSKTCGRTIRYESPNLVRFFRAKRKQGMQKMMIFVMIMLHYLPRFSKRESKITGTVQEITGREPGTLAAFLERVKQSFST